MAPRASGDPNDPAAGPSSGETVDLLAVPGFAWRLLASYPGTVVATVLLATAASLWWVGTREPVWTASATMLLRTTQPQAAAVVGGSELPSIASELVHLGAQRPARETVRAPDDGRVVTPEHPQAERHLGLTTQVDDESRAPLAGFLWRLLGPPRAGGRLFARAERLAPDAPREVRVSFPAKGYVRLAIPTGMLSDEAAVRLPYARGQKIEYRGLALRFEPRGDVSQRTFVVRSLSEREAEYGVRARLAVAETKHGSKVIRVQYADSDPDRAADVVNALCRNYLRLRIEGEQAEIDEAIASIDVQLARVREELDEAHAELVELQTAEPLSVDAEQSAKVLVLHLADLDVELTNARVRRVLVGEALEELDAGDLDALAKVADAVTGEMTEVLIRQIGTLRTQAEMQERSDAGQYRLLLQERISQIEAARHALVVEIEGIRSSAEGLRTGDIAAMGMLGGVGTGMLGVDPVTRFLAERIATLHAEHDEMIVELTPEHPDVIRTVTALDELRGRVGALVANRLSGMERQLTRHDEFLTETRALLTAHPEGERTAIEAALERLRSVAVDHVRGVRDALALREATSATEVAKLRAELAALPAGERRQLGSLQRFQSYKDRVAELLRARESARLAGAMIAPPAELVDPATPPSLRTAPRTGLSLTLAAILGLAAGLSLAFLRDRRNGPFSNREELEAATGLAVLGVVPDFEHGRPRAGGLRGLRHALREDPSGPVAATYRSLRASTSFALPERENGAAIGVTSVASNEGTSATAMGLAVSFAAAGERVLLVNAKVRPAGTEPAEGLFPALLGACTWDEVQVASEVPGLDLLSAGSSPASTSDVLASPRALTMLEEMRASYDLVVFDLPAMSAGADVELFAPRLDGTLLVSRAGALSRDALRAAVRRLGRSGARPLGVVLNADRSARRPFGPRRAA